MGELDRVDKPCEDCGEMLIQVAPMKRFCPECAKERARVYQAIYRSRHRSENLVRQNASPIPNPNAQYCKGCLYWGGQSESCDCCNYIFIEGHKRPCPPGKGCTVRRKRWNYRGQK